MTVWYYVIALGLHVEYEVLDNALDFVLIAENGSVPQPTTRRLRHPISLLVIVYAAIAIEKPSMSGVEANNLYTFDLIDRSRPNISLVHLRHRCFSSPTSKPLTSLKLLITLQAD